MQVKFSALGPEQKGVRLARQHGRRKHKLSLLNLAAVSSASSCPVWCPVPQLALICAERGGTHSLLKWLSHEQKCLYKVSPIYPFHGCVKQTGMFMEHWVTRGAVLPKADHPTLKEAKVERKLYIYWAIMMLTDTHTIFIDLRPSQFLCSPWLFSDEIKIKGNLSGTIKSWIYEMLWGKQEFYKQVFPARVTLPLSADQLKWIFCLWHWKELFMLWNEANACYK